MKTYTITPEYDLFEQAQWADCAAAYPGQLSRPL